MLCLSDSASCLSRTRCSVKKSEFSRHRVFRPQENRQTNCFPSIALITTQIRGSNARTPLSFPFSMRLSQIFFMLVCAIIRRASRRGSSGYAECLCHFLVYGNKSTAVSLFEPFAGICLLIFTYKNHVRMNYKLIGIGSNYFIILLYRIIRNMCNKVFIGIFSTLSLCHKYAWCDRH